MGESAGQSVFDALEGRLADALLATVSRVLPRLRAFAGEPSMGAARRLALAPGEVQALLAALDVLSADAQVFKQAWLAEDESDV